MRRCETTRKVARKKRMFSEESGAIAAWFALFLPVFIGMGALALDMSYTMMLRQKLQISASSAALAGAGALSIGDEAVVDAEAQAYALENLPNQTAANLLPATDIDIGYFNFSDRSFEERPIDESGGEVNAVQVTLHLDEATDNPVSLFLAGIFGQTTANINTRATAVEVAGYSDYPACIQSLEDQPTNGITINGNNYVNAENCSICANSPSTENGDQAVRLLGNPEIVLSDLGEIAVYGDGFATNNVSVTTVSSDGTLSSAPADDFLVDYLDEPPCADPFFDGNNIVESDEDTNAVPPEITDVLDDPVDCSTHVDPPFVSSDGVNGYYNPGTYCNDIVVVANADVELKNGVFKFVASPTNDTQFRVQSGAHVWNNPAEVNGSETGITLVTTGTDSTLSARVSIEGSPLIEFYSGAGGSDFLLFQDPTTDPGVVEHNIGGTTDTILDGIIYAAMQDIKLHGDLAADETSGDGCLAVIGRHIEFDGGTEVTVASEGCTTGLGTVFNGYHLRLVHAAEN